MPVPNRIERTIELSHPVEKVWAALTSAEGLGTWFGNSATVDLRPGDQAKLHWDSNDDATLSIQTVDEPRKFSYTWGIEGLAESDPRRTYVEFTLEATSAGTRLSVVESGFAQIPQALKEQAYDGNVQGWQSELDELVAYLDAAA